MTTFSGHVIASGADVNVAYAAALAKAVLLGAGKEAIVGINGFLRTSTIAWDKRQTRQDDAEEFVRLEFTYEYQSKSAAAVYAEVSAETTLDSFGMDTEQVSGFIVARRIEAASGNSCGKGTVIDASQTLFLAPPDFDQQRSENARAQWHEHEE